MPLIKKAKSQGAKIIHGLHGGQPPMPELANLVVPGGKDAYAFDKTQGLPMGTISNCHTVVP